jgi:hypothetical protein
MAGGLHGDGREACVRTLFRIGGALVLAAAAGYFFAPGVKTQRAGRTAVYDSATETSVSGTLAQPPARGRMGLHLSMEQRSGEMVEVRTAPQGYLAAQGFLLAQGDELEVTGSKVILQGVQVLIAREVTKQGKTVALRDRAGRPLWR